MQHVDPRFWNLQCKRYSNAGSEIMFTKEVQPLTTYSQTDKTLPICQIGLFANDCF